jgi:ketosteroid isomerase-like protein
MSQENVEVCKRVWEAVGIRRDTESALRYTDPEAELNSAIIGGAEGNTYRGHDGIRQWIAESDAAFEELRPLEPVEYRDLGDRVLILGHFHARGRESGVEIDSPIAWLMTLRGGKLVRGEGFLNWADALEAAGLSE